MTVLDCETFDTTLRSVADAINRPTSTLLNLLRRFDPASVAGPDPLESTAPVLLRPLGLKLSDVRFTAVYYFHGTRVADPESFLRDGILPLTGMLDRIWSALYELWADRMSHHEWVALRQRVETGQLTPGDDDHWARVYRDKVGEASDPGPYASLVRDLVLYPVEGHYDYLAVPEIVQDIAGCVGPELQARFEAATTSCVVKFRHHHIDEHDIAVAMLYLLARVRDEPLDDCVNYPSRKGAPVPAVDVLAVDEIGAPQGPGRRRPTLRRRTPDGRPPSAADRPAAATTSSRT